MIARVSSAVRSLLGDQSQPLPQHAMLEQEYVHLHGSLPPDCPTDDPDPDARLRAIYRALHQRNHAALCLSGGGIRSASFAVGILQGLARHRLLGAFDYLSTVAGGGYTGGWLSAWLHHAGEAGKHPNDVFRELAGDEASARQPEPEPVRRIREYSNYLDPKLGLFSVDVWTLVSTVARNLLLNWLVLIPLLAAALLVPRLYYALVGLGAQHWLDWASLDLLADGFVVAGFSLMAVGLGYIVLDLPSAGNRQFGQRAFLTLCFGPLWVSTAMFTLYWAWSRELDPVPPTAPAMMGIGAGLHTAIWIIAGLASRRRWRPVTWASAAVSGAITGLGVWWFATNPFVNPLARAQVFASVGVPLILAIFGGAGTIFIGLASGDTYDEDREWWSRFGGWLLIAITGWLATSFVVFIGPPAARWTLDQLTSILHASPTQAKGLMGLVTTIVGGIAARTSRLWTKSAPADPAQTITFLLAAPTFVVLLLMGLAAVNVELLTDLHETQLLPEYLHPEGAGLPEVVVLGLILVSTGAVMGMFVAVNQFSLHGMYRNRLIRAFLGASRSKDSRHPNRFTGFDPDDNIHMQKLATTRKPLHVINMALNLVADNRLAWQERKAEPFTVSPLLAGTCALGYRPIGQYGGAQGMSLGTAIAISGAAASPNMGYHSAPAITFLLTLFNARLGAWLGNPGPSGRLTWRKSDPLLGAGPLLREMFGRTTGDNPYVYLSDGAHFESLGLYEMVSRRCRLIVVSDATCDPDYSFEALGNAMRKIRIDLGIPITFRAPLRIGAQDQGAHSQGAPDQAGANAHSALADVQYSAVDGAGTDGLLIYVKATLTGDEPADVKNYAAACPAFPHEPPAKQWFGESQFESYRVLGLHTIDEAIANYDERGGVAGLVASLTEVRTPPGPADQSS